MLQEMKHRIKNSIARILAISRQTAASAESLDGFSRSFSARLQSMANAQDMLTRSHWQRADLGQLLRKELEQVFGDGIDENSVSGPTIELDERMTQALGLTFHELATNALKYGSGSNPAATLTVRWSLLATGRKRLLTLDWDERTGLPIAPPTKRGFGSRLIDANIRGELGGSIERRFVEDGLSIHIELPL
ncbi:MAG: sensor histidine kinase [Hyphomicrobiales bacterium]